jgi:hypothetical protein
VVTFGVIVGVALEEYGFLCKALHCTYRYGPSGLWKHAKRKGLRGSAHHIGFMILVVCLSGELALQAKVEMDSDSALKTANTEASRANERAAKIEADAAPRNVKQPKTWDLQAVAALNKMTIHVASYGGDIEGTRLATEILHVLRTIQFDVEDERAGRVPSREQGYGVYVSGPNKAVVALILEWLRDSNLNPTEGNMPSNGGQISWTTGPNASPNAATIEVGAKPLPDAK